MGRKVLTFSENEISQTELLVKLLDLKIKERKEGFIKFTHENGIMTRPAWTPMHRLEIYKDSFKDNLENTEWISDRLVNVPSSPITT